MGNELVGRAVFLRQRVADEEGDRYELRAALVVSVDPSDSPQPMIEAAWVEPGPRGGVCSQTSIPHAEHAGEGYSLAWFAGELRGAQPVVA